MNKDDFNYIVLPIILVICLIGLIFIVNAYGFDYIDAGRGAWDHPPKLCFNSPPDKKYLTIRLMDAWRDAWYNSTGNRGLDFKMATIHPFPQMGCDIELVDGNPRGIGADGKALGAATCNQNSNGYFTKCIIVMYFDNEYWYATVQHEVGHVLGLGHRLPFNVTGFAGVIISNDIMVGQAGSFQKITVEDINALKQIYGLDGFKNDTKVFIPQNYTIIHD